MLTAFPTPVLSIAADAVRDLEGRDALSGLWTLFTKCKESLQDGQRLENISWRLWYCEMMRDDLKTRLHQEKGSEKEERDQENALGMLETHIPTNLYRPPTPSELESMPLPPPYATLCYRPSLISTTTVLPRDHGHATSSLTFSSGLTQDPKVRSISPAGPAPCPAASASLQMSKAVPGASVQQFSLSVCSTSPCGFPDVTPLPTAQMKSHPGSSAPAPIRVGRIIYDMLPSSTSNSWKELKIGLRWAGPPSLTTTTTRTLTIPTPIKDPSALTPTMKVGYSNSTELTSATIISSTMTTTTTTIPSMPNPATSNTRNTSLHTSPPSPSFSDSYARAHPGEVKMLDTMRLEVGVGLAPSLSVSTSSPSSPQVLGNAHIFGLSSNPPSPPRLVVVNPTPNLTPHPTPPASPISSITSTGTGSNNHNGFGGMSKKGDWLMVPPNHHPNQIQDPRQDRSRSEGLDSVLSIGVKATTSTDLKFFSSSSLDPVSLAVLPLQPPLQPPSSPPPPSPPSPSPSFIVQHHQSVDQDQLPLASPSSPPVHDLEISATTNSNRHSISSTTTITSTADSLHSTVLSTATAATSDEMYEGCEVEEPRKTVEHHDKWISDTAVVVGSPEAVLANVDVDAQPMSKSNTGGNIRSMTLGSLLTIQSMSVRKGGDGEGKRAVSSSDEVDDDGRREGPLTRIATVAAAAATKKKKIAMLKKVKTKIKPLKRNSLRSPISPLSPPPLTPIFHQSISSSSTNQKQCIIVPPVPSPVTRRASSGRSSSASASRSGRSSVGVGNKRTNSCSVSCSRSRENRGIEGVLLGMTAATRAANGETTKKTVVVVSTKTKNRPKFMLGRSGLKGGGSNGGRIVGGGVGGGSAMNRRESSGPDPGGSGVGAEGNGGDKEKESEEEKEKERARARERMMAVELIQMQRHQQLLIQQQQLEVKQRMEDEQRALVVQLARQDAHEAEICRQRQRHHLEQQQQQQEQEMQAGTNGLLDIASKRPVRFNIGSNSDEGSGAGSNSKSGSEISGVERLLVQQQNVDSIGKGKCKEQDNRNDSVMEQEMRQQAQQGGFRHHPYPQQESHRIGMMQQQHLQHQHQQRRQQYTAAHHHPVSHHHPDPHPAPHPGEQAVKRELQKEEKGKERDHSGLNSDPKLAASTSKADINNVHQPPPPPAHNMKPKHSTHETLNLVSSALAAKVKHTLSDPLLPGQHKRTIVLTTSESDFEDSDDDGSWSSEEMGSEDDEERQREEKQTQEQLLAQQYYQQQQQLQRQLQQQQQLRQQQLQQLQQRPPPVQRTQSSNYLPSTNHNHNHTHTANRTQRTVSSRGHRHPPLHTHSQALNNQALMTQAAQEAQRQREMFAKKPTESFQNLTQVARTQSVGLLTQLLNPDPEIFPVGHPYRRGYSSGEIRDRGGVGDREVQSLRPLTGVKAMKTDNDKPVEHPPTSRPAATHRKSSSSSAGGGVLGHSRATAALSPPARTLSMQLTKSSAAMPVSSQVQAGSVSVNMSNAAGADGQGVVNGFGVTNMKTIVNSGHSSGGYRPKGPPQDQELEDESGSEPEPGGGIQVSKSVAQEKLKALATRRGIVAHGNQPTTTTNVGDAAATGTNQRRQPGDEDDVPHWARVSQPRQPTRTRSQDQYQQSEAPNHNANRRSLNGLHFSQMNKSTSNHPTPIPFGHPYNLPPPAPPSTPRTTRRLMLSTELSESLRRNLLWERQVSKVNLAAAVRRTASGGGSRHSVLGGLQPLTTAPNVVKLHPKGTMPPAEQEGSEGGENVKKERRASGGTIAVDNPDPAVYENEREERKRLAMARNRSWANNYHYAGW